MENLTNEILVHIFKYLNGPSYRIVVLTCKKWEALANTQYVWSKMTKSLKKNLTTAQKEILPNDELLKQITNHKKTPLKVIKSQYKMMSTCYFVSRRTPPHLDVLGHKLRKQRIFSTFWEAEGESRDGDYILVSDFLIEIEITKKLHIIGLTKQFFKNVTFTPTSSGTRVHNFVIHRRFNLNNTKVHITRADFHKALLNLYDFSSVSIEDCILYPRSEINLKQNLKSLCINRTELMNLSDEDFDTISKITLEKLRTNLRNGSVSLLTDFLKTLSCLVFPSEVRRLTSLLNGGLMKLLDDMFPLFYQESLILACLLKVLLSCAKTNCTELYVELLNYTFLEKLEEILKLYPQDSNILLVIAEIINSLVISIYGRILYSRRPQFFETVIKVLECNFTNSSICICYLSSLWNAIRHEVGKCGTVILDNIGVFPKIVEYHEDEHILVKTCGLLWNIHSKWTNQSVQAVLPIVLKALTLTKQNSAFAVIGFSSRIICSCSEEQIQYLVDHDIIRLLLEMKKTCLESNVMEVLRLLSYIAKNDSAQKILSAIVSNKYYGEMETDKIQLSRILSIQHNLHPSILDELKSIIEKTLSNTVFCTGMDAVVHLTQNDSLQNLRPKIIEIGKIILLRTTNFSKTPKILRWMEWAEMYFNNLPSNYSVCFLDPRKTTGFYVSRNGLTLRHDFCTELGSSVANIAVKSGKWYFELQLITNGLFQIGWVNDQFIAEPNNSKGVGDDSSSWSIDLVRHKKWHKYEHVVRNPYAPGVTTKEGDIVQCYLDLQEMVMGFGLNGTYLGDAFVDDEITVGNGLSPAVSSNLDNEIRFNFGESSFVYPQKDFKAIYQAKK